ncbi:MAG TPA: hypothetical protein VK587_16685 [bacterium]|nr:hypothetical protein [bacterium]
MRKLLAVVLMGGALIVSAAAAFADDSMSNNQSAVGHGADQNGYYWVDQQATPQAPNIQAQ